MDNSIEIKDYDNSSGYGKNSEVPNEIAKHFSWGAFTLNWIWGVGNGAYIALWFYVIGILGGILSALIPVLGILIYLVIALIFCIWLGINGNKFAWQNRKWKSINEFQKVQKTWATIGIIVFIVSILMSILLILPILMLGSIVGSTSKAEYRIGAKKAVSILSQAAQLNIAREVPCPKTFTSEGLAEYFSKSMHGNLSGKKIITSDGMYWQFDAKGGDCSHNDCRVLVDTNGTSKGPNKYWEEGGKSSDRIVIYLKRNFDSYIDSLEIIYPEYIDNALK